MQELMRKMRFKTKVFFHNNSPTILTCIGAAGMIATTVLAVKATPKALKLLEEAKEEKGEELSKAEVAMVAGPAYIPSAVIGVSSIMCVFGANVLNKRQSASLTSAYALLENSYKEYRDKLIELYGKEADREIRDAIIRDHGEYHVIDCDIPEDKLVWVDEISGNSITRYEREIIDAEYHLNRNFTMRGYASLNELYEFLGMPQTEYGDEVGWSMSDGYSWIDFEHHLVSRDDGGPSVYAIGIVFGPSADYLRDWV